MIANLLPGTDERARHEIPPAARESEELVNLDGYWRSAGRPIGRHLRLWVELASPLVAGLSNYLAGLSDISPRLATDARVIDEAGPSRREAGEFGDVLAHRVLADAYAAFLGR